MKLRFCLVCLSVIPLFSIVRGVVKKKQYARKMLKMRTFIENYLHFIKNCIRPPYEKLKSLKSGFIENSNFENNRDPCDKVTNRQTGSFYRVSTSSPDSRLLLCI